MGFICVRRRTAMVLASVLLGCSDASRLGRHITFDGVRLDRATSWSRGGVSAVVFVPPGQTLPSASLQVGVLVSREHASAVELSRWVMEQYHASATSRLYESETADEACKVGVGAGRPPRPFLALQVCRAAGGVATCAEADESLDEEVMAVCVKRGADCWDEQCAQRWPSRRTSLEALVRESERVR